MPMPKGPPARPRRGRTDGRSSAAASLGLRSRNALGLLDVDEHALLRVEEAVVDLAPAAELVDREQAGRNRELLLVLQRGQDRAVALGDEDLLGLRRPQPVAEGRRGLRVLAVAGDCGRVLDQDRLRWDDVVDLLALLLGGDGLVLVGQGDVALAAEERLHRLARAAV